MRFLVTTPVLNGARFIDETILSVVAQAGPFTIRYHIQDGGSKDETLAKLAAWKRRLSDFPLVCDGVEFSFASEPDAGLYDGVARGFAACGDGSVMCWINADDRFEQGAFASVAQILSAYPDILWLCGKGAKMDEASALAELRPLTAFPRRAIAGGIFDGRYAGFITQESVFWRPELWAKAGGLNRTLKLAGDYDLWRRFAAHADLVSADSILGYYRIRRGQLSGDLQPYWAEVDASLDAKQKEERRWQSLLYHCGPIAFRTVARAYQQDWRCKSVTGFKIGPQLFQLLVSTQNSVSIGSSAGQL